MSMTPSGRCGPGLPCRGRAETRDRGRLASACAGRHRDRAGRRRRSARIGGGAGARRRRRDAEPRGAAARDRRTGHGRHRREHAQAARQSLRACRTSGRGTSRASPGRCGPGRRCGPSSVESRFEALHASRPHASRRAGRRIRIAAAALGQSEERRGPSGAPLRRGRHRQIAAHGGASRTPRRRAAHAACAISARRSTPTAHFIRSSARWSAPLDWRTTMRRKRNSTSSTWCSRTPRPRSQDASLFAEMLSLPNDGRYPALELTPQQRRQRTLDALAAQIEALARSKSGIDDLRGRALDRPHELGSARSDGGPNRELFARC